MKYRIHTTKSIIVLPICLFLQPFNDISHTFDVCHKRYSDETGIQSQQYV